MLEPRVGTETRESKATLTRSAARLAALRCYHVLDTSRETVFDSIVELAADVCDAPIALVSFVEADRQWFKAETGLGVSETPIAVSICAHAIRQDDVFVVPDTTADIRFRDNPLVAGSPFIRFYAGAPIVTGDGFPLGTVCVIDTEPRPDGLTARELRLLKLLARQALTELELRRAMRAQDTDQSRQRATEARERAIVEATPECVKIVAADGRLAYMNPAGLAMIEAIDLQSVQDLEVLQLVVPDQREAWRARHAQVCAGESLSWEFDIIGLCGSRRRMETHAVPLSDANGSTQHLAVTRDITARKANEEREQLLMREVDHRAKNLLAVVQSVMQLSRAEDVVSYTDAVSGRIQALARVHTSLAESRWKGADFKRLVAEELAPHVRNARAQAAGPALLLRPAAAQALALVLHELTTNAARHGALSVPSGAVRLVWNVDAEGDLQVSWHEMGGPPTLPPVHHGFGLKVIRSSIERQLKGTVSLDWRPTGLTCEFRISAEHLAEMVALPAVVPPCAEAPRSGLHATLSGRRVLILEDEALVSLQIEATLAAEGCKVVGPASRIGDALALLSGTAIDAALLDVNVAGERSFSVADALTADGVPFAFVTGYAAAPTLPARFQERVVVTKPFAAADLIAAVVALVDPRTERSLFQN